MFGDQKLFLLVILAIVGVQSRRQAPEDIAEIDETLKDVMGMMRNLNVDTLQKYSDQNGEILQLIQELNNLHKETVPLLFLLVEGPNCKQLLKVRSYDFINITQSIDKKLNKFKISLGNTSTYELDKAKEATHSLFVLSSFMFNTSIDLLEKTKEEFNRTINEIFLTRSLKTEGLTNEELNMYMFRMKERIEKIQEDVKRAAEVDEQFSISEWENELKMRTDLENIHHAIKFVPHLMNCTVQYLDDDGAYMDMLSHVHITDLFNALKEIQSNLLNVMKHEPKGDSKFQDKMKDFFENQNNVVNKLINDIENIYKKRNARESNLIKQVEAALKTRNPKNVTKTDFLMLRNAKNVCQFIDGLFAITKDKPLQAALNAAHKIIYFPAVLTGIERAINNAVHRGLLNSSFTLATAIREMRGAMRSRYDLAFNSKQRYGHAVALYLYNVYQIHDYYASVILFQMARDLRRRTFIQNNEKYWLSDVELFVDSNLHLIFGTNCDVNVYEHFGKNERDRVLRQLYAYQEILRIMYPKDQGVLLRTSLLRRELQAYKKQVIHGVLQSTETECEILKPMYQSLVTVNANTQTDGNEVIE